MISFLFFTDETVSQTVILPVLLTGKKVDFYEERRELIYNVPNIN